MYHNSNFKNILNAFNNYEVHNNIHYKVNQEQDIEIIDEGLGNEGLGKVSNNPFIKAEQLEKMNQLLKDDEAYARQLAQELKDQKIFDQPNDANNDDIFAKIISEQYETEAKLKQQKIEKANRLAAQKLEQQELNAYQQSEQTRQILNSKIANDDAIQAKKLQQAEAQRDYFRQQALQAQSEADALYAKKLAQEENQQPAAMHFQYETSNPVEEFLKISKENFECGNISQEEHYANIHMAFEASENKIKM